MDKEPLALLGGSPVRGTFLPYARHSIERDDIAAVAEALAGDWLTQGPTVARFEESLEVITTLDLNLQNLAEEIIAKYGPVYERT